VDAEHLAERRLAPRAPPAGRALVEVAREHLMALDDSVKTSREEVVRFQLGAGDGLMHWEVSSLSPNM